MEWWERIRTIREAKGWGAAELVRRVQKLGGNLTETYFNKIEHGRARNAGIAVINLIPDALEVPRSAVFSDEHDTRLSTEPGARQFVVEQSLERFIAQVHPTSIDSAALQAMQQTATCPTDVDTWKEWLPRLTAFAEAQARYGTAKRQP